MLHEIHNRHKTPFNYGAFAVSMLKNRSEIYAHMLRQKAFPLQETSFSIQQEHTAPLADFSIEEIKISDEIGNYTVCHLDITHCTASIITAYGSNRLPPPESHAALLPLGPVEGPYWNGDPDSVWFSYPTTNKDRNFGTESIVDRFTDEAQNMPEINTPFSGGIYLEDGKVHVADKEALELAYKNGSPTAQLFYSLTSENAEQLHKLIWTHAFINTKIGLSPFPWSWYMQTDTTTHFLTSVHTPNTSLMSSAFPFKYMTKINNEITQGSPWKAAVADSCLGGGILIVDNETVYASDKHPENFHTAPAYLAVTLEE